ncbi:MAG: hypothetical protein NZ585_00600 [Chloracidobacterium sp.]|nr:hypothetical protein [Chloracidobacterium sp.]
MQRARLWFDGRLVRRILSFWLWIVALGLSVWADEAGQTLAALPAGLSEAEQQALQKATDPKSHLEACLKISAARLTTAAEAVKRANFDAAAQSLRVYTGLINYTHSYTQQTAKEKTRRQMLRKLETTLRQQLPLLEWLVNSLPDYQEGCARQALNRAKTIRRESLNAFFGDEFLKASIEMTTE